MTERNRTVETGSRNIVLAPSPEIDATDPEHMGTTLGMLPRYDNAVGPRYTGVRDEAYLDDLTRNIESSLGI